VEGVVLKTYEKVEIIKYLPIRKKDLADLAEITVDNNFSDKHFSISTKIDTLSIEESSIEAFLAHKEVPDSLSEFNIISVKFDLNQEKEKKVTISTYDQWARLGVYGLDKAWVLGKFRQITDFLNSKLKQYEEEQKPKEKDKTLATEHENNKILKTYKKEEDIKYLPIRKKDLADLAELIVENNPSDKYFHISTQIDTLSIEAISIEAFLAHEEVPDPLSRYWITSIKDDLNHGQVNKIELSNYSENLSYLIVSGIDEAWVLGKFAQINEFINKKS
jgi:hypothetical protein